MSLAESPARNHPFACVASALVSVPTSAPATAIADSILLHACAAASGPGTLSRAAHRAGVLAQRAGWAGIGAVRRCQLGGVPQPYAAVRHAARQDTVLQAMCTQGGMRWHSACSVLASNNTLHDTCVQSFSPGPRHDGVAVIACIPSRTAMLCWCHGVLVTCREVCGCEAPPGEGVEPVRCAGRLPQACQALPLAKVQAIYLQSRADTCW